MSPDLHILLVGCRDYMTKFGNALIGQQVFVEDTNENQLHSVKLSQYRTLHVTLPTGPQFYKIDSVLLLREELVTSIRSEKFDAVVFAMEIGEYCVTLHSIPTAERCMVEEDSLKNLFRKKGIIVVREADNFKEDHANRGISVSSPECTVQRGPFVGTLFREVQERCLLFTTTGSPEILAKQRDDLVHMIDTSILGSFPYTDVKFKESEMKSIELEKLLSDLRQHLTAKVSELEKTDDSNSSKTDKLLKEQKETLEMEKSERKNQIEAIKQQLEDSSNKAEEISRNTEQQLSEINKEIAYLRQSLKDQQENSIWEWIYSTYRSVIRRIQHLRSPWWLLLLLLFLSLLLLAPYFMFGPSIDYKTLSAIDKDEEFRRYVDSKFEKAATRLQALEKGLIEIKTQSRMESEKNMENHETDSKDVGQARESVVELFTELKEELRNVTTEQLASMRRTIAWDAIVWGMAQSLPLALMLVLGCAYFLSLLMPSRVRLPWVEIITGLLACLLVIQLVLIKTLLDP